ncbi:hypothetical protein ACFLY9_00160 [Patescibacteria group bacterium]
MEHLQVCVTTSGNAKLPGNVYAVARIQDRSSRECRGGSVNNTRYLEIGKRESPSGNSVNIVNNYSGYENCAFFYSWQLLTPQNPNKCERQRCNLFNKRINVPQKGSNKRRSSMWGQGFGCSQNPIYYGVYADGYNCGTPCRSFNARQSGPTKVVNVLCLPDGNPPTVSVLNIPSDCYLGDQHIFNITGTSTNPGGGRNIEMLELNINGDVFTINIDKNNSLAWLRGGTPRPNGLTGVILNNRVTYNGNDATVRLWVLGLQNLSGEVTVKAWAYDGVRNTGGYVTVGSYTAGGINYASDISWDPETVMSGDQTTLRWSTNAGGDASATCEVLVVCYNNATYTTNDSLSCNIGETQSATITVTGTAQNSLCRGTLSFPTSACKPQPEIRILDITPSVDAWLMTAFGDTYAFLGYDTNLDMQEKNRFPNVPGIGDPNAYFSTYLISRNTGTYPSRTSFRNYLLSNYLDLNRSKVGPTNEGYNYFANLADKNGCSIRTNILGSSFPSGNCNGKNVYFVDVQGGTFQVDHDFINGSSNDACVFIVNGNVSVASSVTEIDAFFISDGQFITETSGTGDSTLVINGGVIANTVDFKRDIGSNEDDPAEIIQYSPRYLDLLKDCIGEDYPYKIREYKYSIPN